MSADKAGWLSCPVSGVVSEGAGGVPPPPVLELIKD